MTNVLPLDAKKELWRMHRSRFIVVASTMLTLLALSALLVLVPSYLTLNMHTIPADVADKTTVASDELKALRRAQETLKVISPIVAATSSPVGALKKALSLRPQGVKIERIRYVAGAPNQIVIAGVAARDELTEYRTALEKDPLFKRATVPVSAFVGTDGGHFSLTITGNF